LPPAGGTDPRDERVAREPPARPSSPYCRTSRPRPPGSVPSAVQKASPALAGSNPRIPDHDLGPHFRRSTARFPAGILPLLGAEPLIGVGSGPGPPPSGRPGIFYAAQVTPSRALRPHVGA